MDFAKILAKIDSIESKTQLNESGAKPDFLDLDKDGDRKEPMASASKSAKDADKQKDQDKIDESAAPGQEEWIKSNKEKFIKQYGKKKGMEVLYATAWKRSKKKDESAQLEECYAQSMMGDQGMSNERSGMSISSSMDTRTGTKTMTVSAEGADAENLAQILKLSGLTGGGMSSKVSVSSEELEEYANEPAPQVQGIETQLQQGNDLNRPKKMTPHGYRNGDNPLAMEVSEQNELASIEKSLMEELDAIKASPVDRSKIPAVKRKAAGGDWKTTTQDLRRERERNISGPEGLAALKKRTGVAEDIASTRREGNLKKKVDKGIATPEQKKEYQELKAKNWGQKPKKGQGVAEGSETAADIDKKIEFHKQGQAAAQYKGSMNKMHAKKIRELLAKKEALKKQGVAEGKKDPWGEGYWVGHRQEPRDCPYPEGSPAAEMWEIGYHEGNKDRKYEMSDDVMEDTKETSTGRVHKAKAGGYGRKFDTDEEGDEAKEKKPEVKRGRGRPKKDADSDTGEVKKWDTSALQSAFGGTAPKKLPGKASVKHKMKDDDKDDMAEGKNRHAMMSKKKR